MAFPLVGDASNSRKLAVDYYLSTQFYIEVLKATEGYLLNHQYQELLSTCISTAFLQHQNKYYSKVLALTFSKILNCTVETGPLRQHRLLAVPKQVLITSAA